jgi:hypothetical protein
VPTLAKDLLDLIVALIHHGIFQLRMSLAYCVDKIPFDFCDTISFHIMPRSIQEAYTEFEQDLQGSEEDFKAVRDVLLGLSPVCTKWLSAEYVDRVVDQKWCKKGDPVATSQLVVQDAILLMHEVMSPQQVARMFDRFVDDEESFRALILAYFSTIEEISLYLTTEDLETGIKVFNKENTTYVKTMALNHVTRLLMRAQPSKWRDYDMLLADLRAI